jgi:hypothetical protein
LQYGQRRSESQQPNSDSGTAWIEPKGLCGNVRNTKHAGRNAAEVSGKDISDESQTPSGAQLCGNESTGTSGSWKDSNVADTDSAQREREQLTLRSFEEYPYPGGGSWWQLESLVGRVANEFSDSLDGNKRLQKKGQINERQICTEASAKKDTVSGAGLPKVRKRWIDSPPPSRLQQTVGCGDSLRQLPRETTRNGKMGGTHENQELPTLQEGISIQEDSGIVLQSFMREQVGMDKSWWEVESNIGRVAVNTPNRVDKLKGLGNAQVPLQAAVAWKLLGGE